MIKLKNLLGINLEEIGRQEKRRRKFFLLKLALYIALLIAVTYLSNTIQEFLEELGLTYRLITAILFYFTGHLIIALSRLLIVNFYIRRNRLETDIRNNFIIGINHVTSVLSFAIFFVAVLMIFDIALATLFTTVSIVAAAIAITFKEFITNIVNGFIIMFSDQLSIGDFVQIGSSKGRISNISLFYVHLVGEDEDLLLIPNNTVMASNVVNLSKKPVNRITVEFEWPIEKTPKLHEFNNYLISNTENYQDYIKKDSYELKVWQIFKDRLNLKFQFDMKKKNREIERKLRKLLPNKIIEFLSESQTVRP